MYAFLSCICTFVYYDYRWFKQHNVDSPVIRERMWAWTGSYEAAGTEVFKNCIKLIDRRSTLHPKIHIKNPFVAVCAGKKKNMYILLFIQVFIFLFVTIESLYLNGHGSRRAFTRATACSPPSLLELLCLLRIRCNGFLIITNSEGWKDTVHQMRFFSLGKKQPAQTPRAEINATFRRSWLNSHSDTWTLMEGSRFAEHTLNNQNDGGSGSLRFLCPIDAGCDGVSNMAMCLNVRVEATFWEVSVTPPGEPGVDVPGQRCAT